MKFQQELQQIVSVACPTLLLTMAAAAATG